MIKLPEAYQQRMKKLLQEEYADYEACFAQHAKAGLRVNTNFISPEKFREISPFALTPVEWTNKGFYYEDGAQPAKHPYYHAGLYYLQEPSAMVPASILPVTPGDRVLDLCAAPGGKSTELAAKLQGKGVLVSNDISPTRAKALAKNIQMSGVTNAIVLSESPEHLVPYFYQYFDKILVDAPCSGEGMFRKENKMMAAWEEHGPDFFAPLQRQILQSAVQMLKPGGMLVYSTCTFSPEEDEENIVWLLENYKEFTLIEPEKTPGFGDGRPEWSTTKEPSLSKCIRVWPHKTEGEGHFVALLQRSGEEEDKPAVPEKWQESQNVITDTAGKNRKKNKKGAKSSSDGKTNLKLVMDFLQHTGIPYTPERIMEAGGCYYLVPEGVPNLSGLRQVLSGLLLGTVEKGHFEPYQALASSLTKEMYPQCVDLPGDDIRVIKYLKGETISIEDTKLKGYVLVLVDGFSLGWAKASNGNLKNKYFSSWRLL